MRGECAQSVAAGNDERLRTDEVERHVARELDVEQRREHGLVPARGKRLGLAARVRFRPRDENAHQASFARNSGPARATSSWPASFPSLVACSAEPVSSTPYDSVPSGVSMRPRKRKMPPSISASPAIGVLHEPS